MSEIKLKRRKPEEAAEEGRKVISETAKKIPDSYEPDNNINRGESPSRYREAIQNSSKIEKKEEEIDLPDVKSKYSTRDTVLSSMFPILGEFLFGPEYNTGAAIAGTLGGIRKEEAKHEDKALKLHSLREKSKISAANKKGSKLQKVTYFDGEYADGTRVMRGAGGSYDPATGTYTDGQGRRVFKAQPVAASLPRQHKAKELSKVEKVKDPSGREKFQTPRGEVISTIKGRVTADSPAFGKTVDSARKEFLSQTKKSREERGKLKSAIKLIESDGQLPKKAAIMTIVKNLESRVSDQDRDFYTKNVSKLASAWERIKEEKSAKIRERLVEEAKTTLKVLLDTADMTDREIGSSLINSYGEGDKNKIDRLSKAISPLYSKKIKYDPRKSDSSSEGGSGFTIMVGPNGVKKQIPNSKVEEAKKFNYKEL